ncbi:MAG: flagellar hook assembly protein FlgD [Spirochaetes bacterium]|nr:flagellar hook assembly protein FlgD [Spirochaetota bacterium]
MNSQEVAEARRQAQAVNARIRPNSSEAPNELGKESFLRLLVTELRHQDPTQPMADREFIAQMAQFSSLEQMRNMNTEMGNLLRSSRSAEAYALLGREIEAFNQQTNIRTSGVVTSVRVQNNEFTLMVGDREVSLGDVRRVQGTQMQGEGGQAPTMGQLQQ